MAYTETVTETKTVTQPEAEIIVKHLESKGYISSDGRPTEEAIKAVTTDTVELPPELTAVKAEVVKVITKAEAVTPKTLSGATYTQTVEQERSVTYEEAEEIITHFEKAGYVTKTGKIKDTMKNDILNGTLDLPKRFEAARERFVQIVTNADRKPPIRDASRDVIVRLKKQVPQSPEFRAIWERIRQKTTYRVEIDSADLIKRASRELREMPSIPKARILTQTADIQIQNMGVTHLERETRTMDVHTDYAVLPDILTVIAEEAFVSWTDAAAIIRESGRIGDFMANPRLFIENCVDIIKHNRHSLAIDGISYTKREDDRYYWQQIFNSDELMANLDKNAVEVKNSVYDYIIYDSDSVERPFAVALDNDPDVKMFFKIPPSFKIETPIGTYNPDWAVYIDRDGEQKMYFVIETKSSLNPLDRRGTENLKIHCGRRHFKALDNDVELREATDWKSVKVKI
jgi:type III restriction enzyme